ncbi:hypothetical protein BH18ACT5_BH18ACT5_12610 [soil metagenome]
MTASTDRVRSKASAGHLLALIAGITSAMVGLWVLGSLVKDVLDPNQGHRSDFGWVLAIGALSLTGVLLFLIDLERPRSRARRWLGWILMVVGIAIPTSLTMFLLPVVGLGLVAFLPGERIDRNIALVGAAALLLVSALFLFSGGLFLFPLGAVLLVAGLVAPRENTGIRDGV